MTRIKWEKNTLKIIQEEINEINFFVHTTKGSRQHKNKIVGLWNEAYKCAKCINVHFAFN